MFNHLTNRQKQWLNRLVESLKTYMDSLESHREPGRFYLCRDGAIGIGRSMALSFSCFGIKIYQSMDLWKSLDHKKREHWVDFIRSFQREHMVFNEPLSLNAFIDPPLIRAAYKSIPLIKRITHSIFRHGHLIKLQQVIISETKQAIATLAGVGESPKTAYRAFPHSEDGIRRFFNSFNWSRPWAAGGQAACLAVFLKTQGPMFIEEDLLNRYLKLYAELYEKLLDTQTGAYFRGNRPEYGELINGAMKVLTALDWLGVPIHKPERLIDTVLSGFPSPEGCHLVDAVYVLYRCLKETDYRRKDVQKYASELLSMIMKHHNDDGGFSYYIGRSQMDYQGFPVSKGLKESDIHGTCLLTWAVAMVAHIMEYREYPWQVIKP